MLASSVIDLIIISKCNSDVWLANVLRQLSVHAGGKGIQLENAHALIRTARKHQASIICVHMPKPNTLIYGSNTLYAPEHFAV